MPLSFSLFFVYNYKKEALMAALNLRKCVGCGAPLSPGSNVCQYCGNENVDESVKDKDSGTAFDVILARVGTKPISVIKIIREITNLGLKEAKDLSDSAPSTVKREVTHTEAEDIKRRLEGVGASVEIRNSSTGTAVYKTTQPAALEENGEDVEKEFKRGCLFISFIIFLVIFVICALIIVFDLDDVLNLN
jgi:ribosomal protein L7/L12